MKISFATLAFAVIITVQLFAQKVDPRHTNYYVVQTIENNDYKIEVVDIVAKNEYCKMKLKIYNKTNDYILFKYGEAELSNASGQFKPKKSFDFTTRKGVEIIEPKGNENVVVAFEGSAMHQDEFKLVLNGFSKFSLKGTEFEANDFLLPANTNDFTAGPFKVNLLGVDKKTQGTMARFNAEYKGDDKHIGIVEPNKVVCRTSKGQEFARANRKDKTVILFDGSSDKFLLAYDINPQSSGIDMQFDNMALVWKDAFRESAIIPILAESATFKVDPGLTGGKNK
jgi:hypothetical protein